MSTNLIQKAYRAIYSRMFPSRNRSEYAIKRLEVCKECLYNSLNFENYNFMQKVKLNLNKVLNYLFRVKQFQGVCLHPDCGCDLIKKSEHPDEECPDNKWKSIYVPNIK